MTNVTRALLIGVTVGGVVGEGAAGVYYRSVPSTSPACMPAPPAPLNPPQAFKQRVNELNLAREMLHRSEGVSGAGLSQNAKLLLGTLRGYASRNSISPYNLGIYNRYDSIQWECVVA
jgi:hypothetical protein